MNKDRHIAVQNVYYMLSYAFRSLKQDLYKDIKTEKFKDISNIFAAILSKALSNQVKLGLYKSYENKKDNLSILKGRLNFPDTILNCISKKRYLNCEYDELTENNIFNQVIKSICCILIKESSVNICFKNLLRKELFYFCNVNCIDLSCVSWSSLNFHKNNQTYKMLLSLCQLVYEGSLMTTESGNYSFYAFIDDQRMCRLYEKFLLEYFKRHFPSLRPCSSQIPWALDDEQSGLLPTMISDICLKSDTSVLVIDAKYYSKIFQSRFDSKKIHSGNLYQIFTYVKNAQLEKNNLGKRVSGMLLYAGTDEMLPPNNVFKMDGNSIAVRTIDLNTSFDYISSVLDSIILEYFEKDEITKVL